MEPQIIEKGKILLVGVPFFGDPKEDQFGVTWGRFNAFEKIIQHRVDNTVAYGVEVYPPSFPKEWKWTYYASVEVSKFDDLPLGLFGMALPASKYVVFTVKGDLSNIGKMFRYAYDEWLPKSNYQSAFPFDFEYYDARFRHDKPESSEIDIYLPIKRRET